MRNTRIGILNLIFTEEMPVFVTSAQSCLVRRPVGKRWWKQLWVSDWH